MLRASSRQGTVRIERRGIDTNPATFDSGGFAYQRIEGSPCHVAQGTGAFLVKDDRIVVDAPSEADPRLVRLSLLGPAIALLLEQQGLHCLHASAVEIEGKAVGFLGPHGAGKSTIAYLLRELGHGFVSDDLLAVDQTGYEPRVVPSFPRAKLWPDALDVVGLPESSLDLVHPAVDKRSVLIDDDFDHELLPLERLYVLGLGDDVAIQPLSASEGLEMLLGNWYPARFGASHLEAIGAARLFERTASIMGTVPVQKLIRPRASEDRMEQTQHVLTLIEDDLSDSNSQREVASS